MNKRHSHTVAGLHVCGNNLKTKKNVPSKTFTRGMKPYLLGGTSFFPPSFHHPSQFGLKFEASLNASSDSCCVPTNSNFVVRGVV